MPAESNSNTISAAAAVGSLQSKQHYPSKARRSWRFEGAQKWKEQRQNRRCCLEKKWRQRREQMEFIMMTAVTASNRFG